jgi:hypothetical protein
VFSCDAGSRKFITGNAFDKVYHIGIREESRKKKRDERTDEDGERMDIKIYRRPFELRPRDPPVPAPDSNDDASNASPSTSDDTSATAAKKKKPEKGARGTNTRLIYILGVIRGEMDRVRRHDLTHPDVQPPLEMMQDGWREHPNAAEVWQKIDDARELRTKVKRYLASLQRHHDKLVHRIQRRVKDTHRKVASFLLDNFRVILFPLFEVSRMARREGRRINGTATRNLLSWAHGSFRETLLEQARSRPWVDVVVCDEKYTSISCTKCLRIKDGLGSAEHFVCPNRKKCDYTVRLVFRFIRSLVVILFGLVG